MRQEGWHWTGGLGFLVPGRGRGRAPGHDVGAVDSRFHGNDGWAGMVVGGSDGWAGMVEGGDDGCRGSAEGGIPRMPWLCEARHSRGSGNLVTFATGRLALGGRPWVLGPRLGSGTGSGGMMEAQWIPVFTGMTGGREWWKAGMAEACHSRESGNLEPFATGRLALDGRPWIPGARWGVGDELRGMM